MLKILKQMNNRREYYYPVVGYALLLALVWLCSWLADIAATFMGGSLGVASLVSSEGVRHALRNAMPSLNSLPWGTIVMAISAYGLLKGSGLISLCSHIAKRQKLTRNEVRSLLFSAVALSLYAAMLYAATLAPWNMLCGVTGSLVNSPLMNGMPALLFLGTLVVAAVYGFMYGNYRSSLDVASSLGGSFPLFVPALLALLPASAIVASVDYMGLFALLELDDTERNMIVAVFYLIPFMHTAVLKVKAE